MDWPSAIVSSVVVAILMEENRKQYRIRNLKHSIIDSLMLAIASVQILGNLEFNVLVIWTPKEKKIQGH